jgi:hypothetical protein
MPIKLPAAVKKKAHSLKINRVNSGRAVTPLALVWLPNITVTKRIKPKIAAIYGMLMVFMYVVHRLYFSVVDFAVSQKIVRVSSMSVCYRFSFRQVFYWSLFISL